MNATGGGRRRTVVEVLKCVEISDLIGAPISLTGLGGLIQRPVYLPDVCHRIDNQTHVRGSSPRPVAIDNAVVDLSQMNRYGRAVKLLTRTPTERRGNVADACRGRIRHKRELWTKNGNFEAGRKLYRKCSLGMIHYPKIPIWRAGPSCCWNCWGPCLAGSMRL